MIVNLIFDSKFIVYRTLNTQYHLTEGEVKTGIYYGFLNTIKSLTKKFKPDNIILMHDSHSSLRREIYPEYKVKRNNSLQKNENLVLQMNTIYEEYDKLIEAMDFLGFASYYKEGIEADDLFYYFVNQWNNEKNIIVSSDGDLYQLLKKDHVEMYNLNTKKIYNEKSFTDEYGLHPHQWALAKAIGGCKSDSVKVIAGISPETAIKYLRGDTISSGKKKLIEKSNREIELGLKLVKLPFCPYVLIKKKTCFNMDNFISFCQKMGFKSFLDRIKDFGMIPNEKISSKEKGRK